jgi:hypothetical protein
MRALILVGVAAVVVVVFLRRGGGAVGGALDLGFLDGPPPGPPKTAVPAKGNNAVAAIDAFNKGLCKTVGTKVTYGLAPSAFTNLACDNPLSKLGNPITGIKTAVGAVVHPLDAARSVGSAVAGVGRSIGNTFSSIF